MQWLKLDGESEAWSRQLFARGQIAGKSWMNVQTVERLHGSWTDCVRDLGAGTQSPRLCAKLAGRAVGAGGVGGGAGERGNLAGESAALGHRRGRYALHQSSASTQGLARTYPGTRNLGPSFACWDIPLRSLGYRPLLVRTFAHRVQRSGEALTCLTL